MVSSTIMFSVLLLFVFSLSSSAEPSFRPKALILPVTKDKATLQYTTVINQRTPLVPVSVVFDLGGRYLWVNCEKDIFTGLDRYVSTSYQSPRCKSAVCSRAGEFACRYQCEGPKSITIGDTSLRWSKKIDCSNNTCAGWSENTIANSLTSNLFALDVVSIQSTNGFNPGRVVKIPNFIFLCALTDSLRELADGTIGMAGTGRHNAGLPSQFAAAFSFKRKFAVCLTSGRGVIFFGNGPYVFLPGIEISRFQTTPLLINPVSIIPQYRKEISSEYFIGLKSIKIAEKTVPIDPSFLKINASTGYGGTKISSVHPYTVLESSIFNAFTSEFVKQATARNITRVEAVKPFSACFSTENVGVTRIGYAVPEIQLVLHSKNVVWRIFGANSMVTVKDDVICLGFVDGGLLEYYSRTPVVIGGYQLEDNLIEIDLASNRLGFSSTLLGRSTNCANFNFTATA